MPEMVAGGQQVNVRRCRARSLLLLNDCLPSLYIRRLPLQSDHFQNPRGDLAMEGEGV